jgi:hypothetical protein
MPKSAPPKLPDPLLPPGRAPRSVARRKKPRAAKVPAKVHLQARPKAKPPAWWPRDAAGELAWVYLDTDAPDWSIEPRKAVKPDNISLIKRIWRQYYQEAGRTWEFRARPGT